MVTWHDARLEHNQLVDRIASSPPTQAASYLVDGSVLIIGAGESTATQAPVDTYQAVYSGYQLQDIQDYRSALRAWFARVQAGGHLVVVVPHAFLYERQHSLPSRWNPRQRRLYTPAALVGEVEEALEPNTYRTRLLCDGDAGYDYGQDPGAYPQGEHHIVLVLEKIRPPAWPIVPTEVTPAAPDYMFEAPAIHVDRPRTAPAERVLVLKLDHLGDLIMAIPALEKLRATFPSAHITLLVGSWNLDLARSLRVCDEVRAFDAFPRNSTEEEPDVRARLPAFVSEITGAYDLAVDLRSDGDTRVLLEAVSARVKAGIGTKTEFRFLDVFLPIDAHRYSDATSEDIIPARDFSTQTSCIKSPFQIVGRGSLARINGALVWGPYRDLAPGRYIFEPAIEIEEDRADIRYDVLLDATIVASGLLNDGGSDRIPFEVEQDGAKFEFRFWPGEGTAPAFRFFGGTLIKAGEENILHQSEYSLLLVELLQLRVQKFGLFGLADRR